LTAEEGKVFKSSLFGGFNRDDVLRYIESVSKRSEEEKNTLRAENESLKAQLAALNESHAALTAEKEEALESLARMEAELLLLAEEKENLQGLLERADEAAAQSGQFAEKVTLQLSEKAAELSALRKRADVLEEIAQLYEKDKNHVASIELTAYRRAQDIEKRARDHAAQLLAKLGEAVGDTSARYDALKTDICSSVTHAMSEMDEIRSHMAAVVSLLESTGGKLDGMKKEKLVRCEDLLESDGNDND